MENVNSMIWDKIVIYITKQLILTNIIIFSTVVLNSVPTRASVFFPRGGSFGYLAALAMPLDLPKHDVFMAFNFEANYGLPSNDSYNEWIDRWNLDNEYLGIGNNVTSINGRKFNEKKRSTKHLSTTPYNRLTFYRAFVGYLNYFGFNGTACLLRSICEVAAYKWEENNGLFGGILKILFMPTTSAAEPLTPHHQHILGLNNQRDLYQAEWLGSSYRHKTFHAFNDKHRYYEDDDKKNKNNNNNNNANNLCVESMYECPEGVINMISSWY